MSKLGDAWKALRGVKTDPMVPPSLKGEIGYTGNLIFSGLPMDEYNPTLSFPESTHVYDEMRRSDGQVGAILNAMKLPIRAAEWYFEPDPDAQDKALAEAVAEFLTDNLLDGGMHYSWDDHLREALLMLDFGFSVFEKVYRIQDWHGKPLVWLDKYAPRIAPSIWRFPQDEQTGAIVAVQQLNVYTGEFYDIPLHRTRLYTFNREGDNPVGISALRQVYKPWYIKSALEKIIAIGVEKSLIGTPYATLPKGTSDADRQAVLNALTAARTSEDAGITIPEGVVLAVLEGKSNPINAIPFLEAQDTQMARSVLAQFLNLGTMASASGGSYALGNTMVGMFTQSLGAIAGYIQGEVQHDMDELVRWNFGPDAPKAKLQHGTISVDSLSDKLTAIAALGAGHLLNPDESLENSLRAMMGIEPLPEAALANQRSMPVTNYVPPIVPDTRLTPAQIRQIQQQQASIGTTQKGMMGAPAHGPAPGPTSHQMGWDDPHLVFLDGHGPVEWAEPSPDPAVVAGAWPRALTPYESAEHLKALDTAWQRHEVQWTHQLRAQQRGIVRDVAAQMSAALTGAVGTEAALTAIQAVTIPVALQAQYQQTIQEQLTQVADTGQASVAAELGALVVPGLLDSAVLTSITQTAALLTQGQLTRLLHAMQWGAAQQAERGGTATTITQAARRAATDRIDGQEIPLSGMVSVGDILNQARDTTATQLGIQGAQWCAVLDRRTCPLCASLDGKVMRADTVAFARFRPPLHYNCRCVRVFIGPHEPAVRFTWVNPDPALVRQYAGFIRP